MRTVAVGTTSEPDMMVATIACKFRRNSEDLFRNDRLDVFVKDSLLAVRDCLESVNAAIRFVIGQIVAQRLDTLPNAWRPECLPSTREVLAIPTDSGP